MSNSIAFNPSGLSNNSSSFAAAHLGDGLNWPWSKDPIPHIPGQNGTPTIAEYEAYLDYLMNNTNTNTTYNGSIQMLQIIMNLGQAYQSGQMSPSDKAAFLKIVQDIQTGNGAPLFANIINMVMMGSFYSNGPSGFSQTNAFCQQLTNELLSLNGVSPLFAHMAEAADMESNYIQETAETKFVVTLNGQTFLTDVNGNLVDFNQYVLNATGEIGSMLSNSQIEQAINNYYKQKADSILANCKNPWEVLMLLIMLLEGQGDDTNRSINGYGNQLNNLTAGQNLTNKILGFLRQGNLQGPDAEKFMNQLNELLSQVSAFDPTVASTLQQQIQSILGQTGVTIKSDGSGTINLPIKSSGAIYNIPNLPNGVHAYLNGVEIIPGKPIYIPAGETITLKGAPNTSYSFTLGQLGSSTTVDGQTVISGLGDWSGIASCLNNPTNAQSLIQSLMSVQGTLNSPSSMINTEIQTATSQLSTENGFWKAGFDSFTNPIQVFTQNMQRSGE